MKISFKEYIKICMFSIIEILFLFAIFFVFYNGLNTSQTIQDYILGSLVFYVIIELNIVKYKLDKLHNELDR